MIASAAGLNTFADRDRKTYLLRIAATAVIVTTYQGSCARSTIATIMAVRIAPLGNSQVFFLTRRMTASARPPTTVAVPSPLATARTPSPRVAIATRIVRMMSSRPFGVLKKFLSLRSMAQPFRLVPLEFRRHDHSVRTHAVEELNTFFGPEHEGSGCQSIGQHGSRSHYGRTRHRFGWRSLAWI